MPVLTRSIKISNLGTQKIRLDSAMSLNLDLPDKDYEMIELTGAWGRERHIQTHVLHQGVQSIYSLRGHSSHHYNPFIGLKRKGTTEFSGEALGFSLIYSGNFLAQVEVFRRFPTIKPTAALRWPPEGTWLILEPSAMNWI
nr:glycoside hydrolase family 36 N-terminal domain-containing protein [Paenibacillus oralis]